MNVHEQNASWCYTYTKTLQDPTIDVIVEGKHGQNSVERSSSIDLPAPSDHRTVLMRNSTLAKANNVVHNLLVKTFSRSEIRAEGIP